MVNGSAVYLHPNDANWMTYLKASCALPLFYRGGTVVDGDRLVDGGVADPLPVQHAIDRGARDIVVVRSRPPNFSKTQGLESKVTSWMLRQHDRLSEAIKNHPNVYMRSAALIDHSPQGISIHHIFPPCALRTGRTGQDRNALTADYRLGRQQGLDALQTLPDG
jgi:predicted patatin/cPLA2 family phospholipase